MFKKVKVCSQCQTGQSNLIVDIDENLASDFDGSLSGEHSILSSFYFVNKRQKISFYPLISMYLLENKKLFKFQ